VKGTITDPEFLASIRPVDLQLYLRAQGWKPVASTVQSEAVDWEYNSGDVSVEVTTPRNARWRDYPHRVRAVLAGLSQLENRSENVIAQDIQRASRDIIRVRAVVDGRTDGSIPLEDGALLARGTRSLMLAAACAAYEPRRAYHNRKPQPATEYVKGLSMGQTEVGSFVLTVLSPVPPAFTHQATLPFVDAAPQPVMSDHYNRKVTRMLSIALGAVRQAAEDSIVTGDITPFDESVAMGVSADLCESLGILRECTTVAAVTISLGWAPSRPEPRSVPTHHEFTPDTLEYINAAGRSLRERSPVDDFEILGIVIAIDRPTGDPYQASDAFVGVATVLTDVDRRPRKVRIAVFGEEWKGAHEAMKHGLLLSCRGELTREGAFFVLRNPRDMMFLKPSDDDV
jgi:hypothetical protein